MKSALGSQYHLYSIITIDQAISNLKKETDLGTPLLSGLFTANPLKIFSGKIKGTTFKIARITLWGPKPAIDGTISEENDRIKISLRMSLFSLDIPSALIVLLVAILILIGGGFAGRTVGYTISGGFLGVTIGFIFDLLL